MTETTLPPGWSRQTIEAVTGSGAYIEKPLKHQETLPRWVITDEEMAELLRKAFDDGHRAGVLLAINDPVGSATKATATLFPEGFCAEALRGKEP